jgi:hypothetical protein
MYYDETVCRSVKHVRADEEIDFLGYFTVQRIVGFLWETDKFLAREDLVLHFFSGVFIPIATEVLDTS